MKQIKLTTTKILSALDRQNLGDITFIATVIWIFTVFILNYFISEFNMVTAFQFSLFIPAILLAEIIYSLIRHKELRLDFTHLVMCMFTIVLSVSLNMFSAYELTFLKRDYHKSTLVNNIYSSCYKELKDFNIANIYIDSDIDSIDNTLSNSADINMFKENVYINLILSDKFNSKSDFSEECFKIIRKLNSSDIFFNTISISDGSYYTEISGNSSDINVSLIEENTIKHF